MPLDFFAFFFFSAFLPGFFIDKALRPAAGFCGFAAFFFADDFFTVFLNDFSTAFLAAFFTDVFRDFFEVDFFRRRTTTTGGIAKSATKPSPAFGTKATVCSPGFSGSELHHVLQSFGGGGHYVFDGVINLIDQFLDYIFVLVVIHAAHSKNCQSEDMLQNDQALPATESSPRVNFFGLTLSFPTLSIYSGFT